MPQRHKPKRRRTHQPPLSVRPKHTITRPNSLPWQHPHPGHRLRKITTCRNKVTNRNRVEMRRNPLHQRLETTTAVPLHQHPFIRQKRGALRSRNAPAKPLLPRKITPGPLKVAQMHQNTLSLHPVAVMHGRMPGKYRAIALRTQRTRSLQKPHTPLPKIDRQPPLPRQTRLRCKLGSPALQQPCRRPVHIPARCRKKHRNLSIRPSSAPPGKVQPPWVRITCQ